MGQFTSWRLGAAAACLALASCGGGGGSSQPVAGGGSAVAAPTPSPTQAPPIIFPPAPFGLTASAQFALVGWQATSESPAGDSIALAQQKGKLAWSADLKTYVIELADLAAGRLFYTFPPAGGVGGNPAAFSIAQADGSKAKVSVSLHPKTAAAGEIYWQTPEGVKPFVYARAIFGLAPASLPASGRREFTTDTNPQSSIVVDFSTRKVSGSLTSFDDGGGWNPGGPKERATLEPADLLADGSFVATIVVPGAPRKGELRGQLFGPQSNELGVYWNAPARDGFDGTFRDWRMVMLYPLCASCPT